MLPGIAGAQDSDMVFVLPQYVTDDVWMVEGFEAPEDAARAGANEARERARASSSRPDRLPEQEYGGVVYEAEDGSYGYTTPRSGASWAGEPNPGGAENPFNSVRPHRGVAERQDFGEWFLRTPEGERVVALYHIHPDEPMDGTVMDQQSRRGPSSFDRDVADGTGLDQYALGPDGFAVVRPDGTRRMIIGQEEVLGMASLRRREFICNADPECDRGRDATCSTAAGRLSCKPLTTRPCLRLERMPPEAFSSAGGLCASALRSLRDKGHQPEPVSGQSPAAGFGGLGGAIATAVDEISNRIEKLTNNVEMNCSLPKPICPPD